MFTSQQYRAKALEYGNLVGTSVTDNKNRKYQKLQRRFAALADNEDWLADYYKQTLRAADTALAQETGAHSAMSRSGFDHAVGDFAPKAATGTL